MDVISRIFNMFIQFSSENWIEHSHSHICHKKYIFIKLKDEMLALVLFLVRTTACNGYQEDKHFSTWRLQKWYKYTVIWSLLQGYRKGIVLVRIRPLFVPSFLIKLLYWRHAFFHNKTFLLTNFSIFYFIFPFSFWRSHVTAVVRYVPFHSNIQNVVCESQC